MATKKMKPRKPVTGNPQDRLFRKMLSRITSKGNMELQRRQEEVDRLNNLPLGHPDHADRFMATFEPMLDWLEQVETTGEMDCLMNGTAILHTPKHISDLKYFELDSALIAVADCYELMAAEMNITDKSDGLRKIGKKVQVGMMLFASDIAAARESIAWMIEITKGKTPLEIQEYTTAISIRAHLKMQHPELISA